MSHELSPARCCCWYVGVLRYAISHSFKWRGLEISICLHKLVKCKAVSYRVEMRLTLRCTPERAIFPGSTLSSRAVLNTLQQEDPLCPEQLLTTTSAACTPTVPGSGALHAIYREKLGLGSLIAWSQVHKICLGVCLQETQAA